MYSFSKFLKGKCAYNEIKNSLRPNDFCTNVKRVKKLQ